MTKETGSHFPPGCLHPRSDRCCFVSYTRKPCEAALKAKETGWTGTVTPDPVPLPRTQFHLENPTSGITDYLHTIHSELEAMRKLQERIADALERITEAEE